MNHMAHTKHMERLGRAFDEWHEQRNGPRWLTTDQAMRHVQRGASTLRRWRYADEVKAHRTSQGWVYECESLEACEVEMVRRYEERPCPGFKAR